MLKTIAATVLLLPLTAAAQSGYFIALEAVGEEPIGYLVEMVKIESVNPPGNETELTEYLGGVLEAEGIAYETYALDPDRANLVTRYEGNGTKAPILIMGHTDVVGVQPEKWAQPPFSGLRKDGYVWGRGTLDDKDNVTAGLMVILLLNRLGVEMDRDVIFLAEAGEEGTPQWGITYMIENHWDEIAAEYAIAEGGTNRLEDGQVKVVGIQTTEKMP